MRTKCGLHSQQKYLHIKQAINCEKNLPVNLILILKGILFCDVCGGGRGGGGEYMFKKPVPYFNHSFLRITKLHT